MNDEEALELLRGIRDLALMGYPYGGSSTGLSSGLVLGLGQIAGIASKALSEFYDRRGIGEALNVATSAEAALQPACDHYWLSRVTAAGVIVERCQKCGEEVRREMGQRRRP